MMTTTAPAAPAEARTRAARVRLADRGVPAVPLRPAVGRLEVRLRRQAAKLRQPEVRRRPLAVRLRPAARLRPLAAQPRRLAARVRPAASLKRLAVPRRRPAAVSRSLVAAERVARKVALAA